MNKTSNYKENLNIYLGGDMPWLRLSALSTGPQRLVYLEKALQANPYNKQTLRLIERIDPVRANEARMWIDVLIEIINSV